jgi:DNA-binding response OmpR family regulator
MENKEYRILVVDDEPDICEILQFNLENDGYIVDVAYSAEEAMKKELTQYHLLLLDVMMGEMSGFKMASLVRKNSKTKELPIIFLTAKTTENDTLTGFTLGADDYILKPFSIKQVIARIKAVLRRSQQNNKEEDESLVFESLEVNLQQKKAKIEGKEVDLTKKEFGILVLLLSHCGQVFSREDILKQVWEDEVYVLDRTVDVNITRLRKKIEPYGKNIVTRLGYGYCFET